MKNVNCSCHNITKLDRSTVLVTSFSKFYRCTWINSTLDTTPRSREEKGGCQGLRGVGNGSS